VNLEDNELIARVARQEQSAFVALYDRYSSRVYTLILHMVNDRMLAEEILQETFLRVWRRAGQFDPQRGSLPIWLLTVARRTALERLRFESRRPALADGEEPSPFLESLPEPETTSEEARWRSLYLAVQALPEEQRKVIELAYYQGLSQSEIAEELGIPLGTVKTRLRTGMLHLRQGWLADENDSVKSKIQLNGILKNRKK
jgi:RNA polymerase sigma-70 factor (ECF subfamily)